MEDNKVKGAKFVIDAKAAWAEVFPLSSSYVMSFGDGSVIFKGYLSSCAAECENGIRENDPLIYKGYYEGLLYKFKEDAAAFFVRPPGGSFLAYGRVSLRKKTIKAPDKEALVKRFTELRDFLRANNDDYAAGPMNLNDKLGL